MLVSYYDDELLYRTEWYLLWNSINKDTISMLYTSKFLALEKSKYVLMSKILTIVIMIIGFITLGPIFGIIGLAITLVIATSADAFYLVLVNKFRERNNE